MDTKLFQNRVKTIRSRMKKQNIGCLIITNPANVTYVTCFSGHDSWALITPRQIFLTTDSRYYEQAQKQCPAICRIVQRKTPITETVAKLLNKQKSIQKTAIEESTSVAIFQSLRKKLNLKPKPVSGIIESLRSTKDKDEIKTISIASKIATRALENTLKSVKPGITENELAGMLDFQIRKSNAANSFETIVAFGPNASRPHHQPTTRKLKKNDTVLIDFGVRYKCYCCDLTRCFAFGKVSALYKKAYQTVKQAHDTAIKLIKDGIEINKIDTTTREVIKESNLPVYGHGTGHGLGLEVHEAPIVSAKEKGKLQTGMVVTIEPGIYIPGKLGVRLEDDVLVTPKGCKILSSNCPISPL